MPNCPDCSGHRGHYALVDGIDANGRRKGWQAWIPCRTCGETGHVTEEVLTAYT